MHLALQQAKLAFALHEVPVGAVLVQQDVVIGCGFNQPIGLCDPTAHAEIRALRNAAYKLNNYRLPASTLYVTVEPCTMCLGAIVHARVERIVFGALEPKAGRLCSHSLLEDGCFNHRMTVEAGVCERESGDLMRDFFAHQRQRKKQLKEAVLRAR
jgi:tRNA(adenine34) deaminase